MAIDNNSSISLPTPPPPRPAARRDAIEAALRKFDGIEDAPAKQPSRPWWRTHQRQAGALATAAIIAVVSIPVALTVLQDQPRPAVSQPKAPRPQPNSLAAPDAPTLPPADQVAEVVDVEVPRSRLPLEPHETPPVAAFSTEKKAVISNAPAVTVAEAPPPPPPPAPAPERDDSADEVGAASIVVSGSRIRQQEPPSTQHGMLAAKRATDSANETPQTEAYGKFLPRLQSAVRTGDRRAVSAMIQYPLRVNMSGGARSYPDRKSVEKDYNQIFTAKVRNSILAQRADQLFVRDQGAMIGDGEVWFDETCRNADCSQVGPVRIKAVNP